MLVARYRGLLDGLRTIVRTDGWRGLLRGAGARCLFSAPSTAITMATMESIRERIKPLF